MPDFLKQFMYGEIIMTLNASILLKRIEQVLDEANMVMDPIEAQAILVGFVAVGCLSMKKLAQTLRNLS